MPWRCALSDDYTESFVELWWVDTVRQLADSLTKISTPSKGEFVDILRNNKISLGKEGENFIRPRPTQRAHSFGSMNFVFYDLLLTIWHENAFCTCSPNDLISGKPHVCQTEPSFATILEIVRQGWEEIDV